MLPSDVFCFLFYPYLPHFSLPLCPASVSCFALLSSLRHNISCRPYDKHSLFSHTHTYTHQAESRGGTQIGSVPPLCLWGMDLSTSIVVCLACTQSCWRGDSAWLLASTWTQILWLACSKECILAIHRKIFYFLTIRSLFSWCVI